MKQNIFFILSIFLSLFSIGRLSASDLSINIDGIVCAGDKSPLEGVIISVHDFALAKSDANGYFSFEMEKAQNIVLSISKEGYSTEIINLKNPPKNPHLKIALAQGIKIDEVVVKAKKIKETTRKTLLFPTSIEKKHSFNVFQMIRNMNLTDLQVAVSEKKIYTIGKRETVILINGVEASPDELATLSSKEIEHIEYQLFPSGKYVGKGAVINVLVKQSDMGGHVYGTSEHGFLSPYGNYLGMVDYKNKGWTFSTLVAGNWKKNEILQSNHNTYNLQDGVLDEQSYTQRASKKDNQEYIRLKVSHAKEASSLNFHFGIARTDTPKNTRTSETKYTGLYNDLTTKVVHGTDRSWSPSAQMEYIAWFDDSQYVDITASTSYARNKYWVLLNETAQDDIDTQVSEHNYSGALSALWSKSFENSSLSVSTNMNYHSYDDLYAGTTSSKQTLRVAYNMSLLQWQQSVSDKFSYYVSGGLNWTGVSSNGVSYHYVDPIAFYGARYMLSENQSLSFSGDVMSTTFSPEYKNSTILPVSFFQTVVGNSDLANLKVYQNTLVWNGHFGQFNLSGSYDFMLYADNITNKYYTEGSTLYRTLINDRNFWSNRFILSISCNLLNESLRLNGSAIAEIYDLDGKENRAHQRDIRTSFGASYMLGHWTLQSSWKLPYTSFGMRQPAFLRKRSLLNLSAAWNSDKWMIEGGVRNLTNRYKHTHEYFTYDVWNKQIDIYNRSLGRNLYLTLTYRLSYGKKKKNESRSYDSHIDSAILKPF